ncbi:MAG: translation factor Sua5, partial [Rubrivivax sp.]
MLLLPGNDPAAVQAAAQRLADGELLGLPTETVYG